MRRATRSRVLTRPISLVAFPRIIQFKLNVGLNLNLNLNRINTTQ